ncbi:MAG: NAD(P)-binding protein [Clostridia bacterium]|nr:NAD(P)-binding protein [Clostridia bacterium]
MKVAIIGAGVSGLSCAFELKKHGVVPTIFECKSHIGDILEYTGVWPRIMQKGLFDPLNYIRNKYGLQLNPLSPLRQMSMYSPNNKAVVRGNLGYTFKRGMETYSLENQIASQTGITITYDSYRNINDLRDDFEFIIVATGNKRDAEELGVWTTTFSAQVRIAKVLGNFTPGRVKIWFNTKFANNAYAYLVPNGEKEATLTLIVNGITYHEMDFYWKEFLNNSQISYPIIETSDAEHNCGFVYPLYKDNVYFVGNTAGMTDDLLGFGAFNAIESGINAARAMVQKLDYNQLMQTNVQNVKQLHEFRKAINTLDNSEYDKLIAFLGNTAVKRLIYNNPLFRVNQAAFLVELYNNFKQGKDA